MIRKIVLIALFCVFVSLLMGEEILLVLFNSSASDVAFGRDSGGANIWNRNPLDTWSNPAKLGYFTGVSYGYSKDPWLDKVEWINDTFLEYSYISLGWQGIGISFPTNGTTLDMGMQKMTDAYGNCLGEIHVKEKMKSYSFGINLLQFSNNFLKNKTISAFQNLLDLSFGYSYKRFDINNWYKSLDNIYTDDFGMLLRFSPLNKNNQDVLPIMLNCDAIASLNWLNLSKKKFRFKFYYDDSIYKERIYSANQNAFSLKLGLDVNNLQNIFDEKSTKIASYFMDNIVSIYASIDNSNIDIYDTVGYGGEITFLDIISFRRGYYDDPKGSVTGDTYGIGINLRLKGYFQLQYNYTKFPGGDLQEVQTVDNWMLNLDILNIVKKVM